MKKRNKFNVLGFCKKFFSVILCLFIVISVMGAPMEALAKSYHMSDPLDFAYEYVDVQYFFPGDELETEFYFRIRGKLEENGTETIMENAFSISGDSMEKDGYTYYSGPFTFPLKPNGTTGNCYIYQVETSTAGNPSMFVFRIYPGFRIEFEGEENPKEHYLVHVYSNSRTPAIDEYWSESSIADGFVSLPTDSLLGDFLGWSDSPDFITPGLSEDAVFLEEGFYLSKDDSYDFEMLKERTENGILKLYPVYDCIESTLEVSVENCFVGETPNIRLQTNRPEDEKYRTYSVKYERINEDETIEEVSVPSEAGNYRVTVIMDKVGSEYELIDEEIPYLTERGYSAVSADADFTVYPVASISSNPTSNNLTYNGDNQALVTAGEAKSGEILYSLSKEGIYSSDIPVGKNAGKYTVWYKSETVDPFTETDLASVEVTINPKTIGLSWSDIEFEYDGNAHCPNATATGVCTGDDCNVTVSGAQTKAGTYTATATALSNSNYALPSTNTKEFKISDDAQEAEETDPDKLKGSVTVSMNGFYYGGKATSPVITSSTNDVQKAKISYKVAGSADSTYSPSVPTEAGNYTVKVTLPSNEKYNAVSATADFTINYLPVPQNAYFIRGTQGKGDWYTSEVLISPGQGYQISFGDRNHFTDNPVKIERNVNQVYVYLRDASTYEQTDVITIPGFKIDRKAPVLEDMESSEIYFADENGNVTCVVNDENLSYVVLGDKKVTLTDLGNGSKSFEIPVGAKKETVSFTAYDLAGNKADLSIIVAPSWKRNGVINEGEIYLEAGEKFTIPEGKWKIDGDETVYYGGTVFYVTKEGLYNFKKQ